MINVVLTLKNFVKEHYWIIFCSFLLTILISAPLLAFPIFIKDEYKGINIIPFGTDAHFYLSRGKEVLDGHNLGSPVLREGKDDRDPYLSYSDYILLAPIKLLGLSQEANIVTLYNTYNFIGIFFLIILIYFFGLQLSGNKLLSMAAAMFVIGGYSIVYHKALFYNDFNIYARILYPFAGSLVLFSYLNLLVKSLESSKLKYKIFTALAFGLLFHIYFYAWTFTLALNVSLFLIFIFRKDFSSAKKVAFISVVGLVLGFYNLLKLLLSLGSEAGKQFSHFMWMSHGRGPIFSKIGFINLIIFFVFWYKYRNDKNLPLILAIIIGGWAALNQQIISGRMLQYGHYYFYFIVPLSIITSFYMVWRLIGDRKWRNFLFIFIIAVAFINTAGGQYKSFFTNLEGKRYEQSYRPIIDFLNRDKTPAVILSSQDNEFLFTIYTPHDLFWQNIASVSNIPIQRFKDALFAYLYLNKESRNNFKNYLIEMGENRTVRGSYYKLLFMNLESYWSGYDFYAYLAKVAKGDEELSGERPVIVDQLNEEYAKTVLKDDGFGRLLRKYGVKYIVWDKNLNPEWDLSVIPDLKELILYNNIYLYGLAE